MSEYTLTAGATECAGSHLPPLSMIQNFSEHKAGVCSACREGKFIYVDDRGRPMVCPHESPLSIIERHRKLVDCYEQLLSMISAMESDIKDAFVESISPDPRSVDCLEVMIDDLDYLKRVRLVISEMVPIEYILHRNINKEKENA